MVGQITSKNELKKNGSGYSDPTAYKAIMNVGGATVMNTYHGDIFYITNDGRAGETPAIIVSPDTWLEQDPEFVQAVLAQPLQATKRYVIGRNIDFPTQIWHIELASYPRS